MSPFDSKTKRREYFENVGMLVSVRFGYGSPVLAYRQLDEDYRSNLKARLEAKLREVNHD